MMKRVNRFLLIGAVLAGCVHNSKTANDCEPRLRALLDVGSGTSKLNLSEVEVCGDTIRVTKVIDDQASEPAPLEASKDVQGAFSEEGQEQGLKALNKLRDTAFTLAREKAPQFHNIDFAAVGTQAYRSASNADAFARKVQALGISLVALPQQKEGEFGYEGVQRKGLPSLCKNREVVVWDVGGGSMQFTSREAKGQYAIQTVGFGAEGFKSKLIVELSKNAQKHKCEFSDPTPNPIGWKNSVRAALAAQKLAQSALNKDFTIPSSSCVIGIGGVHAKAIASNLSKFWPQVKQCACEQPDCTPPTETYTRKQLQCLALYLSEKTDCDSAIQGPYSTTAVSNLYLVLGFMEKLKIEQVAVLNVNMGTGMVSENSTLHWQTLPIPVH